MLLTKDYYRVAFENRLRTPFLTLSFFYYTLVVWIVSSFIVTYQYSGNRKQNGNLLLPATSSRNAPESPTIQACRN